MKEKMWNLLVDSIITSWSGAFSVMDTAITISRECYCELSGVDEEWLKEQIQRCEKEALTALNSRCENQAEVIELMELKLNQLKIQIDKN